MQCCEANKGNDITKIGPHGLVQQQGVLSLPAAPMIAGGSEQGWPQQMKANGSSDRMLAMLNEILQEHASLRSLVQEQHLDLSRRLDDIKMLVPPPAPQSSMLIPKPVAEGEEQAEPAHKGEHKDAEENHHKKVMRKKAALEREEELPPKGLAERIVSSAKFDITMGLVIIFNTIVLFVSGQMRGLHEGWKLGLRQEDPNWATHEARFDIVEDIFNSIYLLELILRVVVYGRRFMWQWSNWTDAIIVAFSCVDSFILQRIKIKFINISVLRLARLARVFRVMKVLRGAAMFTELRILVHTLTYAVRGIIWSVFLLAGIVIGGGILMAQLSFNFFDNDDIPLDRRVWLYEHFGTTMMSIYTMFECTFTGGWRFLARPLIAEVHYLFAVFWISWIVLVNFMTIRVVGALFLKSTLAVAAQNDERLAMEAQKKKKETALKIEEMFKAADATGDGSLGMEEFEVMLEKQDVIDAFDEMGLDTDELMALFSVLSSDDGAADYEEFLNGALAMTASSPSLDNMKSSQNQLKLLSDTKLILGEAIAIKKHLNGLHPQ